MVLYRDSFTCQYCGRSAPDVVLHVDHVIPVSKGGTNSMANLVTACEECNLGKSDIELVGSMDDELDCLIGRLRNMDKLNLIVVGLEDAWCKERRHGWRGGVR